MYIKINITLRLIPPTLLYQIVGHLGVECDRNVNKLYVPNVVAYQYK
jgi:hypothetical protein